MAPHPLWDNVFHNSQGLNLSEILKQNIIFQGANNRTLKTILRIVHQRSFKAGEIIFRSGEPGVGMYIIARGKVRLMAEKQGEPLLELANLKENDFFGELALLDEFPRSATAIAETDAEILGIFRPDFFDLVESYPSLGCTLIGNLAQATARRLRITNEQLAELQYRLRQYERQID